MDSLTLPLLVLWRTAAAPGGAHHLLLVRTFRPQEEVEQSPQSGAPQGHLLNVTLRPENFTAPHLQLNSAEPEPVTESSSEQTSNIRLLCRLEKHQEHLQQDTEEQELNSESQKHH